MRRKSVYVAALAAGLIVTAGSGLAFAETSATPTDTTTTTTTATTTTAPTTTTTPPYEKVSVAVNPTKGLPGTKISVKTLCAIADVGTVNSDAFGVVQVQRQPDGSESATTTVRNVKPGTYQVTFRCGHNTASTTFTVLGRQVVVVPRGPANTGDGSLSREVSNF